MDLLDGTPTALANGTQSDWASSFWDAQKRVTLRLAWPHGVPVNFQFAINLLNEMGNAACATLELIQRNRVCAFASALFTVGVSVCQSNLNAKNQRRSCCANKKSPRLRKQRNAQRCANIESTEDWNRRLPGTICLDGSDAKL